MYQVERRYVDRQYPQTRSVGQRQMHPVQLRDLAGVEQSSRSWVIHFEPKNLKLLSKKNKFFIFVASPYVFQSFYIFALTIESLILTLIFTDSFFVIEANISNFLLSNVFFT